MGRVRYAKSTRDMERLGDAGGESGGVEVRSIRSIRCTYETDAEAAQVVVPRPLEPSLGAEVNAAFDCVAVEIAPDVIVEICSARFAVRVDYDEKPGWYLLALPTNSQQAVFAARERFGEPAKLARVDFEAGEDGVHASAERMGVRYLALEGRLGEELAAREEVEYGYCFKAFPSCEVGKGFDQDPLLVRLEWRAQWHRIRAIEGDLVLRESAFDPVVDLPIRRLASLELMEGTMETSGRILRPVPGDWLLPFVHQRYDEPDVDGVDV